MKEHMLVSARFLSTIIQHKDVKQGMSFYKITHFILRDRVFLCLSLRLECNGTITIHSSLELLGSRIPLTSASRVAGIADTHHHAQLIFKYISLYRWDLIMLTRLVSKVGFHCVSQADLELLTLDDPPASASQNQLFHVLALHMKLYSIDSEYNPWRKLTQLEEMNP
ncbi:Zinc finger protein, partial [Plecturocebus cupreus]